jgi:hypothetical protein
MPIHLLSFYKRGEEKQEKYIKDDFQINTRENTYPNIALFESKST